MTAFFQAVTQRARYKSAPCDSKAVAKDNGLRPLGAAARQLIGCALTNKATARLHWQIASF